MLCSVRARKRFIAASGFAERCFLEHFRILIHEWRERGGSIWSTSQPWTGVGRKKGRCGYKWLIEHRPQWVWVSLTGRLRSLDLCRETAGWTQTSLTDLVAAAGARRWKTLIGKRTTGSLLPLSGRKWMAGIGLMSELAMSWSSSPPTPHQKEKNPLMDRKN